MTDTSAVAGSTGTIVTAGLLIIGDEILSGRTKDKNIGSTADFLTAIGIDLKEVRVVPDDEDEIVVALNALRHRYTYVFTTGGIGPTHDDITADAVAKALGVGISVRQRVVEIMQQRNPAATMNEARLRMARIPDGADLVVPDNGAPGFWIGNVIVMAGVPAIMQDMLRVVGPQLQTGPRMLSASVRADLREGQIGTELRQVAEAFPDVLIGSYPFMEDGKPNTTLVIRSREAARLATAKAAVEAMLQEVRSRIGDTP